MDNSVIEAAGVRVRYGDHEAVRGVDLTVAPGELLAVLGTNGAGKTTLLECLEGLRSPTAGRVRVFGHDPVRERATTRPRMGIMLQEGGFAGALTVRETVELWRGLNSGTRDVDEGLAAMSLDHRADVQVAQLSGGERRRLDVVLATLKEPALLFLDEPTTGLDPESRTAAWEVVRGLRATGTTIVLTTHYLEEAERLADRVVILHEGRVAMQGTLDELVRDESAIISFARPEGHPLPAVRGDVRADDAVVEIRTGVLQSDLAAVLSWADARNVELSGFRAGHATLDDIFAGVVNRARSAAEGDG